MSTPAALSGENSERIADGAVRQYAQVHAADELLKICCRKYKRRSAWRREIQQEKKKCVQSRITRDEFVR